MPRLSPIGLAPAATFFEPSRTIDCASTVAVVVPSPAMSDVLLATSRTIRDPRFSMGSGTSISFATVTPSFVIVGDPNFLSMTTLRPLGPSVTFTASASLLTPRTSAWRATSLYTICLPAIATLLHGREFPDAIGHAQNLVFSDDQIVFAIQFDLRT